MLRTHKIEDILPESLQENLQSLSALAVAFSGGLDSRFLCHAAKLCGCEVLALHIYGPHVPKRESEAAQSWAICNSIPFISLYMNPLEVVGLANNGKERCFFCKKAAFGKIRALVYEKGLSNFHLCDGGNKDDLREYRPGLRAVQDLGFISPLSSAGLGKKEIHYYARKSQLENPDQCARPCLLTRFPYEQNLSLEKLSCLEKTEGQIDDVLMEFGVENIDFRLRMSAEPELHINPLPLYLLTKIQKILENNALGTCKIIQMEKISGYYDKLLMKK